MEPIIVNKWHNPDAVLHSNYLCTYILRQGKEELFRVNVNMEQNFFELSEFVAPDESKNFMIEQINRAGKVNIFDKFSGCPLGMLCGNVFNDQDEQKQFEIRYFHELKNSTLCRVKESCAPEDYAGISCDNTISALFINLPRTENNGVSFFTKMSQWAKTRGQTPKEVMEIQVMDNASAHIRAICALAVIVLARGGLQLPTSWQNSLRKSG